MRCQPSHLGLFDLAHGEKRFFQLLVAYRMQEVTLVLIAVEPLEQGALTPRCAAPGVMAGGNKVSPQHHGVIQEGLELDLPVTQYIRVGCATSLVFGQEMFEYIVPVLRREIGAVQGNAQLVSHGLGVGEIFLGSTVFSAVIFLPVLHKQAFHAIALLLQKQGRHGRIDTAGHADNNFGGSVQTHSLYIRSRG